MMHKTENEKVAKELAKGKDLFYGVCGFNGSFYVGTKEELKKIGVVINVSN